MRENVSQDIEINESSEKELDDQSFDIYEGLFNKQPIPSIFRAFNAGNRERETDLDYFFNLDIIKSTLSYIYKKNNIIENKGKLSYKLSLENIFNKIKGPFIVMIEPVYVDKLYRDSYYHFYSEKLNDVNRNCIRLSLYHANDTMFSDSSCEEYISYKEYCKKISKYKDSDILSIEAENDFAMLNERFVNNFYNYCNHGTIQEALIGTITLRPLIHHSIGRIIFDPTKLPIQKSYLRLAETTVTILGQMYTLLYYPFSGQDMEYISCAETSIWTIFEYFGRRYSDYRNILPHEFMKNLDDITSERTLPTRGLPYQYKSKILKDFGFYPVVYTRQVFKRIFAHGERDFRNIFHCYVESGIPIALTLADENESSDRHAVVCIGHGDLNYDNLSKKSYTIKYRCALDDHQTNDEFEITYLNSSDLIEKYCLIDDNMIPYKFDFYDDFSLGGLSLQAFIVPLNKKIYIDAPKALKVFNELLEITATEIRDYLEKIRPNLTNKEEDCDNIVIRRMFLTSSRKYTAFKVKHAATINEKRFYSTIPYARFLWVMELGIQEKYNNLKNKKVFAEFVLDATSNSIECHESAILIRVGRKIGYRVFDESVYDDIYIQASKKDKTSSEDRRHSFRITTRFFANTVAQKNSDGYEENTLDINTDFEDEFDMYENNLIDIKNFKKGDYSYGA